MKNLTKFATITISLSSMLTACQSVQPKPIVNKVEIQTLWIAPQRKKCMGVAPMQCLMVQETTENSKKPKRTGWQYLYQDIEGFQWQQGKLSKIKVQVIPINPQAVPADASSLNYQLLDVLQ
ncbi:MAG: DUF4377 domain-containing protein [Moraxellaceae bacterium]|nr:DUF4377 domain-containing protein [Moraxellaceae bacterium]